MKLTQLNLAIPQEIGSAKGKVMLVGLLEDGLVGQPFRLKANQVPSEWLGDNRTTRAATFLLNQGVNADNIVYYRLNGKNASAKFTKNNELVFELIAVTASDKENNINAIVSQEGLTIDSYGEGNTYRRTYRFEDYPYLSDLSSAINQDAIVGFLDIVARESNSLLCKDTFTQGTYPLSEGTSELAYLHEETEELTEVQWLEYFELFSKRVLGPDYDGYSHEALINFPVEMMLYPDVIIDEYPILAPLIASIAEQKTHDQGLFCSAILNTSLVPADDTLGWYDYPIDDLTYWNDNLQEALTYEPYVKQEAYVEKLIDLFEWDEMTASYLDHLVILVGNDEREGAPAPATSFVELALTLPVGENPANRSLIDYQLTNPLQKSMVARLTDKGYTCIVPSIRRGAVPLQVKTLRQKESLSILSEWVNLRLIGYLQASLSALLEKYVGSTISLFTKGQVEKGIQSIFDEYAQYSRFIGASVEKIETNALTHEANIYLTVTLAQSLVGINTRLQIKPGGWEVDLWNLID